LKISPPCQNIAKVAQQLSYGVYSFRSSHRHIINGEPFSRSKITQN